MLMILIAVVLCGFVVYHAVRVIKGSEKHHIRLVNILLVTVAAVSFILLEVDQNAIESNRSKYRVHNGTILSGISYEKHEDGYYIFHESQLFSSGEFVIKDSDAKLPWICSLYSPVAIYQSSDAPSGFTNEKIGDHNYPVWENVEKIVPDYSWLCIFCIIISGLMLIAFDAVMLLRTIIIKNAKGGHSPDENEEKTQS